MFVSSRFGICPPSCNSNSIILHRFSILIINSRYLIILYFSLLLLSLLQLFFTAMLVTRKKKQLSLHVYCILFLLASYHNKYFLTITRSLSDHGAAAAAHERESHRYGTVRLQSAEHRRGRTPASTRHSSNLSFQLSFAKNDVIVLTQAPAEGGWWEGTLEGKTGWFPSNYVVHTGKKTGNAIPLTSICIPH